jgi:hypothetical protein
MKNVKMFPILFLASAFIVVSLTECGRRSPAAPVPGGNTATYTATVPAAATATGTVAAIPSATVTLTSTANNTATWSSTQTFTDTPADTFTCTVTPTATETSTFMDTATDSPTYTPTDIPTATVTRTFTITMTPTDTPLVLVIDDVEDANVQNKIYNGSFYDFWSYAYGVGATVTPPGVTAGYPSGHAMGITGTCVTASSAPYYSSFYIFTDTYTNPAYTWGYNFAGYTNFHFSIAVSEILDPGITMTYWVRMNDIAGNYIDYYFTPTNGAWQDITMPKSGFTAHGSGATVDSVLSNVYRIKWFAYSTSSVPSLDSHIEMYLDNISFD